MSRDDFLTFTTPTGIRTSSLPIDFAVLLTDTLESPATFLLTHFVARALREPRKVLFVGLSLAFEHYATVLKKNGIQLANERTADRFAFVDGSTAAGSLPKLYEAIATALQSSGSALVIIDDLSSLLWSGHSSTDVARFFAGVRALVASSSSSLVTLMHGDDLHTAGDLEDSHLFRRVLQQSDLWLQTTSLSSQTRGELSIYRGPALVEDYGIVDRSGPTALQYKLDESGPTFSVKGLGKFL